MPKLGHGTAAPPVGVWREFGFGGGGAVAVVAVVHGGSGLGQTAGRSYLEDRGAVGGIRGVGACNYLGIREQRF